MDLFSVYCVWCNMILIFLKYFRSKFFFMSLLNYKMGLSLCQAEIQKGEWLDMYLLSYGCWMGAEFPYMVGHLLSVPYAPHIFTGSLRAYHNLQSHRKRKKWSLKDAHWLSYSLTHLSCITNRLIVIGWRILERIKSQVSIRSMPSP